MRATIGVKPSLDDTGSVPDVATMMARLKLTGELAAVKKQIDALGQAVADMLKRLQMAARANEIRKQLGAALVQQASATHEQAEPEQIKILREVISGKHDGKGLPELFGVIQEAVNGLDDDGLLSGEAEAVANDAITHWAEIEERESVNA